MASSSNNNNSGKDNRDDDGGGEEKGRRWCSSRGAEAAVEAELIGGEDSERGEAGDMDGPSRTR